jgi:hypothetical protein
LETIFCATTRQVAVEQATGAARGGRQSGGDQRGEIGAGLDQRERGQRDQRDAAAGRVETVTRPTVTPAGYR